MNHISSKANAFIGVVIIAGAGVLFWSAFQDPAFNPSALAFFIGLALLAEALPVSLPKGGLVSVGFAIWTAAIFLFGPAAAAFIAASATFSVPAILHRDQLQKFLFNAAQYAISAVAAGAVFVILHGDPLLVDASIRFPGMLLPFLSSAAVLYLINSTLPSVAIALTGGISFRRVWLANIYPFIPNFAAMSALGMTMAILYARTSYFGLVLLIVPLMVARQTFRLYKDLRESHISTIRSLVASIETKDTYTRGHSERVAEIAIRIGRHMNLPEKIIERLEYAALLHDIGKIGIPKSILTKAGRLDDNEFNEVRRHPVLGAMIVEEIEFLKDVVPIVFHHHERFDGQGYVDGLQGGYIPLMARILAVADTYDAMTSERSYRPPFTVMQAAEEIAANAGRQFDRRVVEAFLDEYDLIDRRTGQGRGA